MKLWLQVVAVAKAKAVEEAVPDQQDQELRQIVYQQCPQLVPNQVQPINDCFVLTALKRIGSPPILFIIPVGI